jgi:molybdopterin/thiamine biosynthesis adenylyltransferase/rhodanese-related sulfurtransferase
MRRYGRHLIMPEVALEGQRKLKAASALIVGAGGLGSPIGLYLAAVGVGRVGIVDFDVVDLTNLQRQIIFGTRDLGKLKTEAAAERLSDLNREIEVVVHETRVTSENAIDILSGYDVVLDGSDNFTTRYLVNDACVLLNKPDVFGSVFRFEGQVGVFGMADGPCYRCLYPSPPPPGLVPTCAEAGVLGALPGVIGSIQAVEAIKLIIGAGDTLKGRLLIFDGLRLKFHELTIHKDLLCPVCGSERTIRKLSDEPEFRGDSRVTGAEPCGIPEMTASQLKARTDAGENIVLIDVREPHEHEMAHIGGELIPLSELPSRARQLDASRETVVYCRSGARSAAAVAFLRRVGFGRVWNLRGGLIAWSDEVDPTFPKY